MQKTLSPFLGMAILLHASKKEGVADDQHNPFIDLVELRGVEPLTS